MRPRMSRSRNSSCGDYPAGELGYYLGLPATGPAEVSRRSREAPQPARKEDPFRSRLRAAVRVAGPELVLHRD